MDIKKITALELSNMIKAGEIASRDAVLSVIRNIEETDNDINAYITVNKESALAEAENIDKQIADGEAFGPLGGVPIAIKDNICTKGINTTCASKMLSNFIPPYNATVIDKIKAAGGIVLGKLNMDEFAMGSTGETSYFGPTKNALESTRVAGGSSSGAAAAVASGEAVIALGSDTGGSIRQPAAYNGLCGFKPTYGTVSRYGLIAYASSLDQIGPIAKCVSDCAAVMDVITGVDEKDSTTVCSGNAFLKNLNSDINGMKIAVLNQSFHDNVSEDIKSALNDTVEVYEKLGVSVDYIELPLLDTAVSDYYIIASAEASSNLSRYDGVKFGYRADDVNDINELFSKSRSEGFGQEVKKRIILGTFVLSSGYYDAYYRKALQFKNLLKCKFDEIFEKYDAVICPTTPTTAPRLCEIANNSMQMYLSDIFTVPANLAGLPALSVPCGKDKEGLPIGLQIIGQRGFDQKVLNLGFAYEQATSVLKEVSV